MKKSSGGAGLGSSTLVMLFSVLCLTVFAVLSFSTARADLNLSESYARSVEGYYRADTAATEVYARLKGAQELMPELEKLSQEGLDIGLNDIGDIVCVCPIDENLAINVELRPEEELSVVSWNLIDISDWEPDTKLRVWDPSSMETE